MKSWPEIFCHRLPGRFSRKPKDVDIARGGRTHFFYSLFHVRDIKGEGCKDNIIGTREIRCHIHILPAFLYAVHIFNRLSFQVLQQHSKHAFRWLNRGHMADLPGDGYRNGTGPRPHITYP